MRKGVAVPYIVALILGIVVIGLLGYWFFILGGQTGGSATSQSCSAKQASWCQQWSITGFAPPCPPTQCITQSNPDLAWQSFAPGCGTSAPGPTFCRQLYGQSTSAGQGPSGGQPTSSSSSTSSTSSTGEHGGFG